MRLSVRVIPRASREEIVKGQNGMWKVYLHASPERGKANERLLELMAEKFSVSKNKVKIIRGETARLKLLEVLP